MSVVYSLYDALVSINVPDAKAKAVIDAMEREMMDKLATKADLNTFRTEVSGEFKLVRQELASMREALSKDILTVAHDLTHTREFLSRDIKGLTDGFQSLDKKFATKADLAEFGERLTTKLYTVLASSVVLNCTIVFGMLKLLR
ncbi:MAG: hypothetical protein WDO12_06345 [Pseudomonadota bacterium]